ncbi:TetR/AcrR family transcriptional regulator [Nocardioides insulae]|uniref:TetR/AcrR family transcriptional regulator n=1 Tax=Nocardioides insulae TaxID=394734 RepID=UPI000A071EA8|nr:helix-turn-helix domain-containing protein [Nocardioides insulae]
MSRAAVVEAAFTVADREGLAAVSMARIGEELGVTAMALYRHVASKDELLELLADRISAELAPLPPGFDWRAGLESWTLAQIQLALTHPWFIDLPLPTARVGPQRMRWLDQGFTVMRGLPLNAGEKLRILGFLAQHVLGEARVQIDSRRAAASVVRRRAGLPDDTPVDELDPVDLAAAEPFADLEEVLAHYADPESLPGLYEAVLGPEGVPVPPEPVGDEIGFGITVILDGLEVYLAQKKAR